MKSSILFSQFFGNNLRELHQNVYRELTEERDLRSIVAKSEELRKFVIKVSRNDMTEIVQMFEQVTKNAIDKFLRACSVTSEERKILDKGILVPLCPEIDLNVVYQVLDFAVAHALYFGLKRVNDWQTSKSTDDFVDYIYRSVKELL